MRRVIFHPRFLDGILFCLILALILVIYGKPVIANPDPLRSFDGTYHTLIVKKAINERSLEKDASLFWGGINTNYPPVFHAFAYGVARTSGLTNIYTVIKLTIIIVAISFFLLYALIARHIFWDNRLAWAVTLITLALAVYPIRRLSFFLPENLALVFFLLFVLTSLKQNWPRLLRLIIGTLSLILIILTNVLTSTVVFAGLSLWIPILVWKREMREAILLGGLAGLSLLATLPFISFDLFWINYLSRIIPPALLLLGAAIGFRFLERYKGPQYARKVYTILLIIVALLTVNYFSPGEIRNSFLSEQYWTLMDLPIKIKQLSAYNFFSNGNSQLSINPLVSWLGIIGLLLLAYKREILSLRYGFLMTIFVISLITFFFGAYLGINPSINTPRSILYIAIILPLLVGVAMNYSPSRQKMKIFLPILVVFLLTSALPVIRYTDRVEAVALPPLIVDATDLDPGQFIFASTRTFTRLYVQSTRDLTRQLYTPLSDRGKLLENPTAENLKKNNIKLVITDPTFPFFSSEDGAQILPDGFQKIAEAASYRVYSVNPAQ